MEVNYLDHMGTDASVVDAARVSFDKRAENYTDEQNERLIKYLARHNHWTPFGHATIKLHIKAPIFVARQLAKHQVGFVWNEVSRRYVDTAPEFYFPSQWRKRAENIKQGSSDDVSPASQLMTVQTKEVCYQLRELYRCMVDELHIAPEMARMILPQNTYTEWHWTGSLAAWARLYHLRSESSAQEEVRVIADKIDGIVAELFPVSWNALKRND